MDAKLLIPVLMGLALAWSVRSEHRRAVQALEAWARRESVAIDRFVRAASFSVPASLRPARGLPVFRVWARTPDGARRAGYVRCGEPFWGVWRWWKHEPAPAQVLWDDAPLA